MLIDILPKDGPTFEEVKNLLKDRVITQKQKDNLKLELEKKISQYKIIER